jgi:hypothetical protein
MAMFHFVYLSLLAGKINIRAVQKAAEQQHHNFSSGVCVSIKTTTLLAVCPQGGKTALKSHSGCAQKFLRQMPRGARSLARMITFFNLKLLN